MAISFLFKCAKFFKQHLIILVLAFTSNMVYTQTVVTIGTGTNIDRTPFGILWGYERTASLFLSSEMTTSGVINKIGWYPTINFTEVVPVKIYLKQITYSTIPSNLWNDLVPDATLIFEGNVVLPANQWYEINLANPFIYDNASNLMVLVETNYGGTGFNNVPGSGIRWSSSSGRYCEWKQDNTPPTGGGYISQYRPNIRFTMGPPALLNDVGLISLQPPTHGCNVENQSISVKIKNYGINNIASGLTATYIINPGNVSVTESIPVAINSQAEVDFTFSTPAHFPAPTQDSCYNITIITNLASDLDRSNDTLKYNVVSLWSPPPPLANNLNTPFGYPATLTASSPFPIYWYSSPAATNYFNVGNSFTTPILYDTTTYYISCKKPAEPKVIIGNQTTTQNYAPYSSAFDYGWSACIYKASEINKSMFIDTIAWEQGTSWTYTYQKQKIYLQHISDSVFTNNNYVNPAGMTKVYDGNITWQAGQLNKIALSTPYKYDGVSNLLVVFQNFHGAHPSTNAPVFRYTPSSQYCTNYGAQQSSFPTTSGTLTYNRPNIHFFDARKGCESNRVSITANIASPPANSAKLKRIVNPNSGNGLTFVPASVVIENKGSSPINNFPVKFSVNNQLLLIDTVRTAIMPDDSLQFTFANQLNFSDVINTCYLKAWTELSGDLITADDTSSKTIVLSLQNSCTSYATNIHHQDIGNVTFGEINNGVATPINVNPLAVNTYTDFTHSTFANVHREESYPISISQISDANFYAANIKAYIDFNRNASFDLPQEQVFSGQTSSSNTTLTGSISIPSNAVNGYTRMRIVIDMNTNALPCGTYTYGETEDYTVKILSPYPKDIGISEILNLTDTVLENNNISFKAIVKNFGSSSIYPSDSVKLQLNVNQTNVQNINYNKTLLPNASDTVSVNYFVNTIGNMNLCFLTKYNNDINLNNDTICATIYGKRITDIGILAINQPNGILYAGDSSLIDVEIKNFGTHTISSFPISYQINQNVINEVFSGSIAPNSSVDFSFAQKILIPQNNFNIKCYTSLPADQIRSNDSLFQNISVQPKPSDAGITSIVNPAVQVYAQDSVEVTVSVKNYGMTTLTNIPLAYKVNGVLKSLEICNNVIQPNASINYTFQQKFLAPSNNFNIQSYSNIANDFDRTNDSISASINVVLPPTIDIGITALQSPENSIYAGDSATVIISIKNYGSNAANNFSVSYKINNVLIANETCTTAINSNSTLDYTFSKKFMPPASDFNLMAYVSFIGDGNKINDTIKSNINIIIPSSIDAGITNVLAPTTSLYHMDSAQVSINIKNYGTDVIANIPVGYKINGLINVSEICSTSIAPNANANYTFNKKFCVPANNFSIKTFCSLPDDIYRLNDTLSKSITQVHAAHIDGAITAINLPATNSLANDSSVVQIVIKNSGSDYMFYVPVTYQINNETPVSDMFVGFINVNATANFSFKKKIKIPTDDFVLKVFCSVANDLIHNNDTIVSNINIVKPMYDAAVVDIIQPADTSYYGQNTSVLVQIKNFGSQSIQNFPVSYKYGNSAVITENIVNSIAADDTYNYLFSTPYVSDSTLYNLCAYTALAIDMVNANNQFCRQIRGVVGIDEYQNEGLYLWQNMPNPASDNTIIMLSLPKTCKANLIIRNMFGQIVYENYRTFPEGKSYLNLDLSNFSAGVYTYCLEYNGLKLIKKMIVNK